MSCGVNLSTMKQTIEIWLCCFQTTSEWPCGRKIYFADIIKDNFRETRAIVPQFRQ